MRCWALPAIFFLAAILAQPAWAGAAGAHVVDVERIMASSKAAMAASAHVREARKALERGFEELRALYEDSPEDARQRALGDGWAAVSRQLALERQAADAVVARMMLEEIRAWREKNGADLVIPRQNALDAAESADITDEIMRAMDARTPRFPDLPKVSVTPPATPAP